MWRLTLNKSQIASILIGLSVFCGILIIPFPVGLYYVTRIVICGGAIYAAIQINKHFPEEFNRVVLLWFLAFLFNPLLPLYFQARLMWIILDIVALIAFYSSAQLFKNSISVIKETKEFGGSNSKQHRQDTYTYADGDKYEGEYKDDKRHGQGTRTWTKGDKYVGEWKEGKRHGQGTFTDARGSYVGEWKDDKKHGQGTFTEADGTKYEGEYKDDKRHGQGTYTLANGTKYVGEYKEGKIHGQGTHTFPNGDQYVGEWKDDKRHGQGTRTWTKGDQYIGEWKDGKQHGQGTFTDARGSYVGEWKEGSLISPLDKFEMKKTKVHERPKTIKKPIIMYKRVLNVPKPYWEKVEPDWRKPKEELNQYTIEGKSEIESDDNLHLDKELETFVRYFFEVVKEVYQKGQNNFGVKEAYNLREKFKLESKNRAIENLGVWKLSKAEADAISFASQHDQTIMNQILGKNRRLDFNHAKVQEVMKYLETIK